MKKSIRQKFKKIQTTRKKLLIKNGKLQPNFLYAKILKKHKSLLKCFVKKTNDQLEVHQNDQLEGHQNDQLEVHQIRGLKYGYIK